MNHGHERSTYRPALSRSAASCTAFCWFRQCLRLTGQIEDGSSGANVPLCAGMEAQSCTDGAVSRVAPHNRIEVAKGTAPSLPLLKLDAASPAQSVRSGPRPCAGSAPSVAAPLWGPAGSSTTLEQPLATFRPCLGSGKTCARKRMCRRSQGTSEPL